MKEEWKDIKEYEGKYQISNYGNIKRLAYVDQRKTQTYSYKEMLIKPQINNSGYLRVALWKDGKNKKHFIHRLVAEHFIENPKKLPEVNHDDGNKQNNHVSNIEWISISENQKHARRNKLFTPNEQGIHEKKKVFQINRDTKEVIKVYDSVTEAVLTTGVKHVSAVCRGERKTVGGYFWRYQE